MKRVILAFLGFVVIILIMVSHAQEAMAFQASDGFDPVASDCYTIPSDQNGWSSIDVGDSNNCMLGTDACASPC